MMTRNVLVVSILVCLVGTMVLSGCKSNEPKDVFEDVGKLLADGDVDGAADRLEDLDIEKCSAAEKLTKAALDAQIKAKKLLDTD